jgi:hypothetical protein
MWPKIESGKITHGENDGENYLVKKLRPDKPEIPVKQNI